MRALRFSLIGSLCISLGLIACAQSGESDFEGSGGSGNATTYTTTSSTTSGSTTTTGQGGSTACPPPQHQCGQVCAGNTPQTGCYQSETCQPCTPVPNGTTICSDDGLCDVNCISPYEKVDGSCECPSEWECCSSTDCAQGTSCNTESHQCIAPCDDTACMMECLAGGSFCMPGSCCDSNGECACGGMGMGGFGM